MTEERVSVCQCVCVFVHFLCEEERRFMCVNADNVCVCVCVCVSTLLTSDVFSPCCNRVFSDIYFKDRT